jgi:16S rRNA (cytidine1402-2'-O)-methyltransferase
VAGTPAQTRHVDAEGERVLRALLSELPVRQAASLAARITGGRKADLYRRAIEMKRGADTAPS